jgi:alanine dehydrogenase
MLIGVPKEIKDNEFRVGMVPATVRELVLRNHTVLVEANAGTGIGFSDNDYRAAGAQIQADAKSLYAKAEMIVKVKEPQATERCYLNENHVLFTYLHLAADGEQTAALVNSNAVCIAYETITSPAGGLPLLAPMSEVAGRMSVQAGASCLEKSKGGKGILLGGVPGVSAAKVVIIGGGVVGNNAAQVALGMGAQVTILDNNVATLRRLNEQFGFQAELIYANKETLGHYVASADLVIGGVLVPGAAAPKLVSAEMISTMQPGSVVVDVAIDQGGCIATSRPTTHQDPCYIVDNIVHYCVTNIPGAVARTSSFALNNATLPYVLALAERGWQRALKNDPHFLNGLNICHGKVTNRAVAESLGYDYVDAKSMIE